MGWGAGVGWGGGAYGKVEHDGSMVQEDGELVIDRRGNLFWFKRVQGDGWDGEKTDVDDGRSWG